MNANRAVVHVEALIATDHACTVRIRGASKESVSLQRIAQGAVEQVIKFLQSLGDQVVGRCA